MKTFFTVFFAILAAAAVIFAALWAKSRVNTWEWAWRSYESQMSVIVSSDSALTSASEYSSFGSGSVEASMARVREAEMNFNRIKADQVRIADFRAPNDSYSGAEAIRLASYRFRAQGACDAQRRCSKTSREVSTNRP